MKGPASLDRLVTELQKLPGVGRKTAERLAFHVLKGAPGEVRKLAQALIDVKEKVRLCSVCCSVTENDPCDICSDTRRDRSLICVVEEPADVFAIERINEYKGVYHVLMGALSPLDGVGPEELKLEELEKRVEAGGIKEVILATNPNVEGEATAMYVARLLTGKDTVVTRIARGLPMGGDLEYADEVTLSRAMEECRPVVRGRLWTVGRCGAPGLRCGPSWLGSARGLAGGGGPPGWGPRGLGGGCGPLGGVGGLGGVCPWGVGRSREDVRRSEKK